MCTGRTPRRPPIARDGLTIITHPRNPAQGLTLLQLRALYRGEVLDWAALGGPAYLVGFD